MQTLKNKAFRVSIQWNALVRKLLALARGGFTHKVVSLTHSDDEYGDICSYLKIMCIFKHYDK
ncbi:hypothetical protein JP0114_14640 [Helicobacter pylori]